ncbi:hypothetical protein WR25_13867 [Diploscapter pachys]|uniref:Uncharacterized protein n=1 Tax=Diploscapter pachys TaxID=2018661 RepID=A0A2A2KYA7_9BILA|nr:hypothetical protein WR25_13867 [Diploscapter pachys]
MERRQARTSQGSKTIPHAEAAEFAAERLERGERTAPRSIDRSKDAEGGLSSPLSQTQPKPALAAASLLPLSLFFSCFAASAFRQIRTFIAQFRSVILLLFDVNPTTSSPFPLSLIGLFDEPKTRLVIVYQTIPRLYERGTTSSE